jgi:hypothetical protein
MTKFLLQWQQRDMPDRVEYYIVEHISGNAFGIVQKTVFDTQYKAYSLSGDRYFDTLEEAKAYVESVMHFYGYEFIPDKLKILL